MVFATEGGTHAMGVFSPDQPSPGYEKAGYGRFRFKAEKVVKWNCVFRPRARRGSPRGSTAFACSSPSAPSKTCGRQLGSLVEEFKAHLSIQ